MKRVLSAADDRMQFPMMAFFLFVLDQLCDARERVGSADSVACESEVGMPNKK